MLSTPACNVSRSLIARQASEDGVGRDRLDEACSGMTQDIRSMYHFLAVAEEMSFTRAAARLGIAQPWLSQRIRLLEEHIGKPLFRRTTRRIELTNAGTALLKAATPLTAVMADIEAVCRGFGRSQPEQFRIGGPPYGSRVTVRNRFLTELAAVGGGLPMEVEVGWSPHLCRRVRDGDLDAAFAMDPLDEPTLNIVQIGEMQRLFVFTQDDPLRGGPGKVQARDLVGRKVCVFPRGANPALFDRTFEPLIHAHVELVPVDFNGHILVDCEQACSLIQSYFGDPAPNAARGERLLAGSERVAFNFVTRNADRRPLVIAAREIARRCQTESDRIPAYSP